mmetsp:Transcript_2354/g.3558  ORF Transcript_2354/g.3558 Transcript_2354/m.3558 type:complete len:81 (-) Transcript_2354:526-768(-)
MKAFDTHKAEFSYFKNKKKLDKMTAIKQYLTPLLGDHKNFVAIKKLFYDRRYEQRELSTLQEIKNKNLCENVICLRDKYF